MKRILIVDDEPQIQRLLAVGLKGYGYGVTIAINGQEAIMSAASQQPNIIVLDIDLGSRPDGLEVCAEIRKWATIPIIMLTAKADMESNLEGLEKGADAYLMKPFHKEELLLRIKKLLELRQKLQQHYLSLAGLAKVAVAEKEMPPVSNFENAFVTRAKAIVEAHLDDFDFDVEKFCRALTMSHAQVHRKLSALTGLSANKFIRSVRLSKAKILLKNPEITITAVAFDTGFNDPSYFGKVFKQEFGLTPAEWREMNNIRK